MSNNSQWNSFLYNKSTPILNNISPPHFTSQSSAAIHSFSHFQPEMKYVNNVPHQPLHNNYSHNDKNLNCDNFSHENPSFDDFPTIDVFNVELCTTKNSSISSTPSSYPSDRDAKNDNKSCNSVNETSDNQLMRETGIIEKLLHSYGFIQCCERKARLFFHFSQFNSTIEHLKIGDPVEFEMKYDRKTGKPLASAIIKIAPDVVTREERVTGTVITDLDGETSTDDIQACITFEYKEECFFLPFRKDDVTENVTLHIGDEVSFQVIANNRGNLGAAHIRLENNAHPVKQ